ncbi:hypothetical protein D3C75_896680 [compost metagenome]
MQDHRQRDIIAGERVDESGEGIARQKDQNRRRDLNDEFRQRREVFAFGFVPVIDRAYGQQKHAANEQGERTQREITGEQQICNKKPDKYSIAGCQRNGLPMYFALHILPGLVHKIKPECEPAKRRNQQIDDAKGHQKR